MVYRKPTIHVPPGTTLDPNRQAFQIARPVATHFEAATCREKNCPHYLNGWKTIVPTESAQANYIRRESGRHFKETKVGNGMSEFVFPPGQRCFRDHYKPLDKQEIFLHRTAEGSRVHQRPTDWTEHMNEEIERVNRMRERG